MPGEHSSGSVTHIEARTQRASNNPDTSNKVKIFISYARADAPIARVLYEELKDVNNERVDCFLDTETIGSGEDWPEKLNKYLQEADWLVCIYTGDQSEFCGYEVGVFQQVNNLSKANKNSPVVCLHDVPDVPTLFQNHQNRLVECFRKDGRNVPNDRDERDFYSKGEIAKFFANIYGYKGLYVVNGAMESQLQTEKLCRQAKRVADAFYDNTGTDIKSNTPTQYEIDIKLAPLREVLTEIPDDAEVEGTFGSLALLGLLPPSSNKQLPITTWGNLKRVDSPKYRGLAPWIERLEQDMMAVMSGKVLTGKEAIFSANGKVYQAILSRHLVYINGSQKFIVSLVETSSRQFFGNRNTSLMLAGIVIAARFRFEYLEVKDALNDRFGDSLSFPQFQSNCWQLHCDLDRLRHESIELGILDPDEFIKAFGENKRGFAESLLRVSIESRNELFDVLPGLGETFEERDRRTIKVAIFRYFDKISPVNIDFLVEALEVLRQEFISQKRVISIEDKLEKMKPSNGRRGGVRGNRMG